LTDFVAEEDYSNAVALNASAIHIGRIVGPAVAGLLIGWLDEATCFLFSSSCYVVFVAFLLSVRVHARTRPARTLRLTGDLIEGLKYVWYDKDIRALLTLIAAFSFLAQPYIVLMPVFARDVLHSDARGYGLLMSAPGVSAVVGALIVASMKAGHRGRYLIKGGIAFSVSLLVFSLSRWLPLSWVLLLLVGIGQVTLNVLARSLLQIIAAKEFRGRVASFFSLFYNGLTRLGGLEAGALSQYVSAPFAIQVGAVLSLAWVLLVAWRVPSVRRLP